MSPKGCHLNDTACSHYSLVKALTLHDFVIVSLIRFEMLSHPGGYFVFIEKWWYFKVK